MKMRMKEDRGEMKMKMKRQGKRKTEADGRTDPNPRRGGRTEVPEQTYTGENQNLPKHARAKPTWREEHA